MNNLVVLYHGNCYDGVTAAWVAYQAFGKAADYVPMLYSDKPPDVSGKRVFILDFSFKRDVMKQIIIDSKQIVVLDHHQTAEVELNGILEELEKSESSFTRKPEDQIIFDMNRSGAGLAWDYFFPNRRRLMLVDYVEDRDLWRFKLADSKFINAWIQSWDINLETWIKEVGPRSDDYTVVTEGVSLLRQQDKYVRAIADNAQIRLIPNTDILAPYVQTSILMSEVCSLLLERYPDYPVAFYSFYRKDGKHQYGLRSRPDFDCSVIAKANGGGGHKQAAGFEL